LDGIELREVTNASGASLTVSGFASVTGVDYEMYDIFGPYTESVSVNAFDVTLKNGVDCAFLINHEGLSLARTKSGTLQLSAIKNPATSPVPGVTGLYFQAQLDPSNLFVQAMKSAVNRGDLDECSFAFRCTRSTWSPDYMHRSIDEVAMDRASDVSLCNFGANEHTGGTVDLRARRLAQARAFYEPRKPVLDEFEARLRIAKVALAPPSRDPAHLAAARDMAYSSRVQAQLRAAKALRKASCNRCSGEGTVSITCPQCGGDGGPQGNGDYMDDEDENTYSLGANWNQSRQVP
jgi:hypothetical protein